MEGRGVKLYEITQETAQLFFYCGIEKEEYNAVKKDAYVSNFEVWRILHFLMAGVFLVLFIASFTSGMMGMNRTFYLAGLIYSAAAIIAFFLLKKDSLAAQLLIYLSMSVLFLIACILNLNKPTYNATTFIALLLVMPMFMIDKPFFMTIELFTASAIYLFWMYRVKVYDIWYIDMVNVVVFTFVGCVLNVIANSLRIREFVLTRTIRLQRDLDEMTGLKNKPALTREINEYLADETTDKGLLFIIDVDKFKSINDVYGHDVGDSVIIQLGHFLGEFFTNDEVTGRFGGDEFIVFIKGVDMRETGRELALELVSGVRENVSVPDDAQKVNISVGIAVYNGQESNYSELFKKADTALYKAKSDPRNRVCLYGS